MDDPLHDLTRHGSDLRRGHATDDTVWVHALLLLSVAAVGVAAAIDAAVGGPGVAPDVVATIPRDRDPAMRTPAASNDVAAAAAGTTRTLAGRGEP